MSKRKNKSKPRSNYVMIERMKWKMMKQLYYRVVLYDDNTILPLLFDSWEEANNYIRLKKLHAYITII